MQKNIPKIKERSDKIKLIIFDFDGTLFDTKKAWYDSILKILKKRKIFRPEIEATLIIHFGKKIKDMLKEIEIDDEKIKSIEKEIHREMERKIKKIKAVRGIDDIKNLKCRKIIVSNSNKTIINKILSKRKKYFDEIYGAGDFESKEEIIKSLIRKYKVKRKNVAYVGDRAGDIILAKKIGCISIGIISKASWNSRKEILGRSPDFVITKLKDLLKIFY